MEEQTIERELDEIIQCTYAGITEIGKGGFGCVFKGENILMKENHAIKIQDINNSKERAVHINIKIQIKFMSPSQ